MVGFAEIAQAGLGLVGALRKRDRSSEIANLMSARMQGDALYKGKQIAAYDARNAAAAHGFNPLTMLGVSSAMPSGFGGYGGGGPNLGAIGAMQNAIGLLSPETETTGDAEEDQKKQADRLKNKVERDQRIKPPAKTVAPSRMVGPRMGDPNSDRGGPMYDELGFDKRTLTPDQIKQINDSTYQIQPEPLRVKQPITDTMTPKGRRAAIPDGDDIGEMAKNLGVDIYGRMFDSLEDRYERKAVERQQRIRKYGYPKKQETQTRRQSLGPKPKPIKRKRTSNTKKKRPSNF